MSLNMPQASPVVLGLGHTPSDYLLAVVFFEALGCHGSLYTDSSTVAIVTPTVYS